MTSPGSLPCFAAMLFLLAPWFSASAGEQPPVSEASQSCLECHAEATPGIVAAWKAGRMARRTPAMGLKEPGPKRRVSAGKIPADRLDVVVGCAECHTMNPAGHPASFDHEGFSVHTVVSPADCAVCHTQEAGEYKENIMSHAVGNLRKNPVYMDLARQINATQTPGENGVKLDGPDKATEAESCFYCHGTAVKADGVRTVENDLGEFKIPRLSGWPNHGVGRINPDGSKGSCGACHSRHSFSIKMARSPQTCAECHKGPDVPAYKVYQVSKHGALYSALGKDWEMEAVPWVVGRDFKAPTCAACHVSLVTDASGKVIAKRTHRMTDRLSWRIMGFVYAHPQPKSPDTSLIRNKAGLSLPTDLDGSFASAYLIGPGEQKKRRAAMSAVCLACHSSQWVDGQFARYENTIGTTNRATLGATGLMRRIWKEGLAKGPEKGDSRFNENIERLWVEQWLFDANITRYASAMMGADYGVFAGGRWQMNQNLRQMLDWYRLRSKKAH